MLDLHKLYDHSGSETRTIKNPPPKAGPGSATEKEKVAIGSHTDFGSLAFLHNRLGGLQVLPPGCEEWQYVRPLPGHAICNIGDALTLFSGGILHSNMHRVVPPPGEQRVYERWSVVFHTRPGNNVILRALVDESDIIKTKVNSLDEEKRAKMFPQSTASQWLARRIKNRMVMNRMVSIGLLNLYVY